MLDFLYGVGAFTWCHAEGIDEGEDADDADSACGQEAGEGGIYCVVHQDGDDGAEQCYG